MSEDARLGRRFRIAVVYLAGCIGFLLLVVGSLLFFLFLYRFFPSERVELRSPGGKNAAFVESAGFVDPAYLIQVRDWPWTFIRPYCVGDVAYWDGPEIHYSSAHWTSDGSALVVMEHRGRKEPWLEDAYDYRGHCRWEEVARKNPGITPSAWIAERGGIGEDLEFHELKGDEEMPGSPCPWWVKAAPAVAFIGGLVALVRFVKRRVSIARKYPI